MIHIYCMTAHCALAPIHQRDSTAGKHDAADTQAGLH
jgi:hypothetical protein